MNGERRLTSRKFAPSDYVGATALNSIIIQDPNEQGRLPLPSPFPNPSLPAMLSCRIQRKTSCYILHTRCNRRTWIGENGKCGETNRTKWILDLWVTVAYTLDTYACARVCTQNPATEYAIDQLMQQEGTIRIGQGEGKRHCERTYSGEMDRRVGRSENR